MFIKKYADFMEFINFRLIPGIVGNLKTNIIQEGVKMAHEQHQQLLNVLH